MKYFIEHKETRKWWHPVRLPRYVNSFNGSRIRVGTNRFDGWTHDPNEAHQFDTEEQANDAIKLWVIDNQNVFVTEHEFVGA